MSAALSPCAVALFERMQYVLEHAWYAVHTKPKQETRAVRNLNAWNIETFLPTIATSYSLQHREALFPGYIFAFFNIHQCLHKLQFTRGVAHVVSFAGQPAVVSAETIDALRDRIKASNQRPRTGTLKAGDAVLIRSGALGGLIGVFEREMPGHERVRVLLNTLSHTARLEVPRSQVSSLEEDAAGAPV